MPLIHYHSSVSYTPPPPPPFLRPPPPLHIMKWGERGYLEIVLFVLRVVFLSPGLNVLVTVGRTLLSIPASHSASQSPFLKLPDSAPAPPHSHPPTCTLNEIRGRGYSGIVLLKCSQSWYCYMVFCIPQLNTLGLTKYVQFYTDSRVRGLRV